MNNKSDLIVYNYSLGFEFIADAEEYTDPDTGRITYYFFDIYKYRNIHYKDKDFTKRLDGITKVYEELKVLDIAALNSPKAKGLPIIVAMKNFVELRGKYREILDNFIKAPKKYVTDGFIIINNRENISYKYKLNNTVDFFIKKTPNGAPGEHILYCTINEKFFKEMSLPVELLEDIPTEFKPEKSLTQNTTKGVKVQDPTFPIPFISSLDSSLEVSSYTFPDGKDHDGKIAEFAWDGSYVEGGSWKFHKFRTDREITKTYFGNHYKVAESNFSMDMINFDITEETGGYFDTSNKKAQENVRRYTNLVMKQMLFDKLYGILDKTPVSPNDDALDNGELENAKPFSISLDLERTTNSIVLRVLKKPLKNIFEVNGSDVVSSTAVAPIFKNKIDVSKFRLFDVSCGRGQDLNRYGPIDTVLGLDIDKNAIIEMIDRRLVSGDFKKVRPKANASTKEPFLLTSITDITDPAEKTFNLLEKKHSLPRQYFSHSVCMLAFHYFCDNATTMNNALEFISGSLQPGGKFGMILYDGSKILDLMGDKKMTTKFPFGEEMCLKKNYKEYTKFGTKIGVKLPFSGDKFYDENVVVINDHLETFQKHGLHIQDILPFEDYFDNSTYKITDIDDKNYLSLYQCVIFRKK